MNHSKTSPARPSGTLLCVALLAFMLAVAARGAVAPMVVHEWGTFTSLQNDKGEAIGGINSDDEPVPRFVHRLASLFLLGSEVPPSICQGAPHCHPDVTMRLETPVIYFHPLKSGPPQSGFEVSATFRGGWLSEYFPNAETDTNQNVFGPLRPATTSRLTWKDVQLAGDWPGPATTDHVWTAPRAVDAAQVQVGAEAERFLFYRGVAHLDAPVSIARGADGHELVIRSQVAPEVARDADMKVKSFWLVHIRNDGQVAFREISGLTPGTADKPAITARMEFTARDYSAKRGETLRSTLMAALVDAGLFRDEAQALLNTWELSYFKSAGWRVFFLVPRAWTDLYLPLHVSIPSEITRVMVGRIELVSDEQKDALKQMASFSEDQVKAEALQLRTELYSPAALASPANHSVFEGRRTLDTLGISIPKSYALYLGLGRFRNALLLDEQKNYPSKGLEQFISAHGLMGHDPAKAGVAALSAEAPR
jgi:hypothetical protein